MDYRPLKKTYIGDIFFKLAASALGTQTFKQILQALAYIIRTKSDVMRKSRVCSQGESYPT